MSEKRRSLTDSHKANISKAVKGKKRKPMTPEHKLKISATLKERGMSKELKDKIKKANKERIWTDDLRKKVSDGRSGIKHTEEFKDRMRKVAIDKGKTIPVKINGIKFTSLAHASKELNMFRARIRHRCLSDNFSGWNFL